MNHKITNFELTFSSTKGDFTLNVDYLAVLDRKRIPFLFLVAQEATITTIDQAAVAAITDTLLRSALGIAQETNDAMLVEANGSQWILYGRREATPEKAPVMVVKARMIKVYDMTDLVRPELESEQSMFLTKKVRSALHEHQVKNKSRRQALPPQIIASISGSAQSQSRSRDPDSLPSQVTLDVPRPGSTNGKTEPSQSGKDANMTKARITAKSAADPAAGLDKVIKDKLKKMVVTLLSLQSITKKSASFKDMYQHTLQAATFALRDEAQDDLDAWETRAMAVCQMLLQVFSTGRKEFSTTTEE